MAARIDTLIMHGCDGRTTTALHIRMWRYNQKKGRARSPALEV
jgi:hypothetical protein